ncbi:MAG: ATP-binding protein [Pseudomonadota bacterium]
MIEERKGMWSGRSLFGKLVLPLAVFAAIVLAMIFGIAVVRDNVSPLLAREEGAMVRLILSGVGTFLIATACAIICLKLQQKLLNTENLLVAKQRELENEQNLLRQVELDLRQSLQGVKQQLEERVLHTSVIEQTEDNVLITDNHRTIIYINPAFERSSGYSCEELKQKPLSYLRSDQHDQSFYRVMKEILDRGEVWRGIIINKGKNGVDFEIEGTISPIRESSGAIGHWLAVGRNMSRLRKLERELMRVQKMDALGTLAGGIAHDFNNVLAAVMGLLELQCLDSETGNRTRKRMEQALSACMRARDLVKQILTFSRQGEQRRKPLRMGTIIEDALQMLRATLPTTITIESSLTAANALILGDSTQIHQVLVNLCTNAAHAMRLTGGVLRVSLEEMSISDDHFYQYPDLQPGPYLCLKVSDTGEGMAHGVQERIFEPFFTTKKAGEGAGVGLSVVHGIVKSHGGKIDVWSEPGKGTTFQLLFPKITGNVELVDSHVESLPLGNERILLVDDEDFIVEVASEMLKYLGYEVVAAQTSLEALEIFRAQPDQFQLILTDLTMPGITGIELAAELLQIRRDVPIILCTGFSDEKIRAKALTIGIRKTMAKPFIFQELAALVREVLDH